ncbi:MAG: DegQ family serine endoprotease [Proteobacteria bacterium]|jgi:Do/DeqQ family serine protease|nr:DegQ family serine endoprotease [Pseudomonadota bacterium]MCG6935586.1 DegQ family serine endoprotease [Pseudomonadota bacterium]
MTCSRMFRYSLASLLLLVSAAGQAALPFADSQGKQLPTLAPMLEQATPAVVNIATTSTLQIKQNPLFSDPFFKRFFNIPDQPTEQETQSLGSGVIVDASKGYILTNNHVVEHADEIRVTLRSGETRKAKLIGTDPETDIAVIQIDAKNLSALPLANSDELRVGDFVVAIGNPFGLGQTVTSGIVSAKGRSGLGIEGFEDFIQTDASINPGNSGGALVNLRGELVGINTAILSQSGGNIGIGFAIPIRMAESIMQQLVAHGKVRRGRLGAQAQDLTPELAQAFDIKYQRGAVVAMVTPDSPADRAGLKVGDIVVEINGRKVNDADTLRNYVGLLRVGETVTLKAMRNGKTRVLKANIEEYRDDLVSGEALHPKLSGASFKDLPESSPFYGRVQGVLISAITAGSPAAQAGLREGDLIASANRQTVTSVNDLRQKISNSPTVLLDIRRGNQVLFLYLR